MADDYTTVRVKKSTRDLLNETAASKGVSISGIITSLMKTKKDTTKQILVNVDSDKFYALNDLTRVLFGMKLIQTQKLEDTVSFALQNLMTGMEKTFQNTKNFSYEQPTVVQGQ